MTAPAPSAEELAALEELLYVMPPPGRKMFAPKLAAAGVRVHPELATKKVIVIEGTGIGGGWAPRRAEPINDSSGLPTALVASAAGPNQVDIEQMGALALAVMVLPPPLPRALAPEFYELGARVHPELATAEDAPAANGKLLQVVRHIGERVPELAGLADRIEEAQKAAASGDRSKLHALVAEMAPKLQAQAAANRQRAADIDPEKWADEDAGPEQVVR
ncbi:MAG: hypothetical protein PGN30_10140 [Mycolicibacterium neoaurum]|uniref:hypothetical protein n=1 Tax=Mycolicibacterium neoaurum TaxID=1795 RepID=UPI002FF46842